MHFATQRLNLAAQAGSLECILDGDVEFLEIERLADEVVRAELQGSFHVIQLRVSRDHDHGASVPVLFELIKDFEAAKVGHAVGRKKDLLIVGGENIYPQDIEEIVAAHPAIHDGRAVAMGVYNSTLGTEDIVVVAEVEQNDSLARSAEIERELRSSVVAELGVAVRTFLLKPLKWIVESTAGKPARANTLEKLLKEHPEFNDPP